MKRLYVIEGNYGGQTPLLNLTGLEEYSQKRGNILASIYSSILADNGYGQLSSDGLRGVIADGVPAPQSTVILLQEVSGVYTEVGRKLSTDGSWSFDTLSKVPTIAVALLEGYNAGIVSGLNPGGD